MERSTASTKKISRNRLTVAQAYINKEIIRPLGNTNKQIIWKSIIYGKYKFISI